MDRLLKRRDTTLFQPPTVGCTHWVLVWPCHRPVMRDKLAKNSSLVSAVCHVTYPSVTCSLVWRKPALCQQVYIPCTYKHATCMMCYLHSALRRRIEVCKFGWKCLSGSSVPRLICMTHREAKMQQLSGGTQGGLSAGTCLDSRQWRRNTGGSLEIKCQIKSTQFN